MSYQAHVPGRPNVPEVDAAQAHLLATEGAFLLDVRELDEWTAGRIDGAELVPLGLLDLQADVVPADRRVVVICRVGARSARATEFLLGRGHDAVNLAGGMKAWAAAGYPMVSDAGEPQVI